MTDTKTAEDFLASRDILRANIPLFHAGTRELYRVVAVELRKLLCDGKSTLVPRLSVKLPGFHPLIRTFTPPPGSRILFELTAHIVFDGTGGSRIKAMFDVLQPPIPLDSWLDQTLFNGEITIRNLIRSVADKEAAHSDAQYNNTLEYTRMTHLVNEDIHKQYIIAIGEYVLRLMEALIAGNPQTFLKRP